MAGMIAAAALLWLAGTAGRWRCLRKMGCRGWEAAVPVYRTWLLFHELYGSGRRILRLQKRLKQKHRPRLRPGTALRQAARCLK